MEPDTPPQVALVSGAAHGIGAAISRRLTHDGWRVVMSDIDEDALFATCTDLGPNARPVPADVGDEDQVLRVLDEIRRTEQQLDALVCNAGVIVRRPLRALDYDTWSRVIATNLTSCFLLAHGAEDLLRESHGRIVTIASTRAHMSEPDTEAYAASKGGLVALSHALAISLGPDVRVNCISPGWIATGNDTPTEADHAQHPAGRVGTPDDVAAVTAWLLGPESGFVTGAEFIVDGGMTRKMIYA